jgi:hypothetical protein
MIIIGNDPDRWVIGYGRNLKRKMIVGNKIIGLLIQVAHLSSII